MALVLSTHGNTAFRSEDVSSIAKVKNLQTGRATKLLSLTFKSGIEISLKCKTIKEANELFDIITKVMLEDYKLFGFHKP